MKKTIVTFLLLTLSLQILWGQEQILPVPSTQPSPAQQKQIARKYGMFIHFGINTFHDQEWTDGSKSASSYSQPPSMQINGSGSLRRLV